uniref:Secreted protein n=1 Tax=Ascaris lumbricoides TaxID=6252 RepID=A0A0M3IH21_ASCLU
MKICRSLLICNYVLLNLLAATNKAVLAFSITVETIFIGGVYETGKIEEKTLAVVHYFQFDYKKCRKSWR